jgi:hypothetical protein
MCLGIRLWNIETFQLGRRGTRHEGSLYECNHYFFRPACRSVHTLAAPLDTQETTDRRVPIPKNVPLLRIDHISIESALLGVRGKLLRAAGWPDCEETNLLLSARGRWHEHYCSDL